MILSRYPIASVSLDPYKKVSSVERYLATKSNLVVDVDPEHPDADADREDELRQAAEACEAATARGNLGIIIGDLNCGPEASAGNFSYILEKGFRDTYAEGAAAGKLESGPLYTWDPQNYLNSTGPHKDCPGQRCDHVLLPHRGMENWRVERVKILFEEKVADVGGGKLSTLSDHHGLLVVLRSA
jgi:hypothetical protein